MTPDQIVSLVGTLAWAMGATIVGVAWAVAYAARPKQPVAIHVVTDEQVRELTSR